jgi:8-oxo-dGTP pyrophosphatase MutT (NUDIX family)
MAYVRNNRNKKKNKTIPCTNCGKIGHEYRDCEIPITSWGIILVNINNLDIKHDNLTKPIHIYSSLKNNESYKTSTIVNNVNNNDKYLCSVILDNIKFLMISRKHSLGYVEFVRGRYKVEKPMQVTYLFKLMTTKEIEKIKISLTMDNGFEYLWKDMWGNKADHTTLELNKRESIAKYNILKYIGVDGPEIGLEFMVNKVTAQFDINEWGFPKGRRHRYESDKECAVREFTEESGYTESDIKIIDVIEPIIEEFLGTNGVKYRHVYYVAELISKKEPQNDITESQIDEIEDITFMNLTTANQTIRPYHEEKINMITSLTYYYFDTVYNKLKKDNLNNDQKDNSTTI